jgi:DNA-binding NarL/FixJ family response regulator
MNEEYLVAVIDDHADFRDMLSDFINQAPGLTLNGSYESLDSFMSDHPLQHDLVLSDLLLEPGATTTPLPTLLELATAKPELRVLIVTSLKLDRFITALPPELSHQVRFLMKNSSFNKEQLLLEIESLLSNVDAPVLE